jgi:hypothetical protein
VLNELRRITTMIGIRAPANGGFAAITLLALLAAGTASAQDQPIKRTELLRSDLADVPGKQTVIYMAEVAPGEKGHGIPIMAMNMSTFWKERSISSQTARIQFP